MHLVSAEQDDPISAYREVRGEIEAFGHGLGEKREVVILSKIDLMEPGDRETLRTKISHAIGKEVLEVSVEDPAALKRFSDQLAKLLSAPAH